MAKQALFDMRGARLSRRLTRSRDSSRHSLPGATPHVPLEAGPAFADLTTAGGTCTARTADGGAFYNSTTAANLFNDNYIYRTDETHRLSVSSNARFPIAIDYDFDEGNAKAVNAYKVYGSAGGRCPKAWTIYGSGTAYGSADETGWTKLDMRSGVGNWTYVASGSYADCKTFTFKNDTPYRCYRFLWQAGETAGTGSKYHDMTQLEYFRIDGAGTPGVLCVDVADGAAVTNETVAVGVRRGGREKRQVQDPAGRLHADGRLFVLRQDGELRQAVGLRAENED